jgi:hypothetical protein
MRRVVVAFAVLVAGCQPHYDGVKIREHNGSGEVRGSSIEVIEGQALVISIRPASSNPFEDYEAFNIVRLEALDENIVLAAPADEIDRFVIVGVGIGRTTIDLTIDGRLEDTLDAETIPQPEGP